MLPSCPNPARALHFLCHTNTWPDLPEVIPFIKNWTWYISVYNVNLIFVAYDKNDGWGKVGFTEDKEHGIYTLV